MRGNHALLDMNKPDGLDCPSCAWPDPRKPHAVEYSKNGAKALAWEATRKRASPQFFAQHKVAELGIWIDHELEDTVRLTHPMRYNPQTETHKSVSWDDVFAEIGQTLRVLDPKHVAFYSSGRAPNKSVFLYQL